MGKEIKKIKISINGEIKEVNAIIEKNINSTIIIFNEDVIIQKDDIFYIYNIEP